MAWRLSLILLWSCVLLASTPGNSVMAFSESRSPIAQETPVSKEVQVPREAGVARPETEAPASVQLTPEAFQMPWDDVLAGAVILAEGLLDHQLEDGALAAKLVPGTGEPAGRADLFQVAAATYEWLQLARLAKGEEEFLGVAERSLLFLLRHGRGLPASDEGVAATALVGSSGVARLGTAALTLLALQDFEALTGRGEAREPMAALAAFLARQQEAPGNYRSWLPFEAGAQPPYDPLGDAALTVRALLRHRLYVGEEEARFWVSDARRGAGWLMGVRDLGKTYDRLPEDLSLLRALDLLHETSGGGRTYYLHARRLTEGILLRRRNRAPTEPLPCSVAHSDRLAALSAMVRIARREEVAEEPYWQALNDLWQEQVSCMTKADGSSGLAGDRSLRQRRHRLSAWLAVANLREF